MITMERDGKTRPVRVTQRAAGARARPAQAARSNQKLSVAAPCFSSSWTLLAPVMTVPGRRSSCV